VLASAVSARHAYGPARAVRSDDRMHPIGLAGAAEIFERLAGLILFFRNHGWWMIDLNMLPPGAFHFKAFLTPDRQRHLVEQCRALIDGPVPAYVPVVRGGGKMHVRMLCLGLHWNGRTYKYESTRSDYDDLAPPPLPENFSQLAADCAEAAGMRLNADLCILNYYEADGRMGLHQDKDESERSIAAGLPVVSISLGDTARFLFGGLRRRDPVETIPLESGDAFVFGGPSRLRYHGVTRTMPGTAPPELRLQGRFNLTFRQFDVA
jgi:alkylated DNA repair protein (DNA oxidative demethylase)